MTLCNCLSSTVTLGLVRTANEGLFRPTVPSGRSLGVKVNSSSAFIREVTVVDCRLWGVPCICPTWRTTHGRRWATRITQKYLGASALGKKRTYEWFSSSEKEAHSFRKLYRCEADNRHCIVANRPEGAGLRRWEGRRESCCRTKGILLEWNQRNHWLVSMVHMGRQKLTRGENDLLEETKVSTTYI